MIKPFRVRAMRVIDGTFSGEHHVFSLKWDDDGSACTFLVSPSISTYDYADLTRLVVHCHDECVRGQVSWGGPGYLKITLSDRKRKSKHPDCCAHPTLEQHVEQIRRGGSYQPLFNQLREEEEKTCRDCKGPLDAGGICRTCSTGAII